MKKDENFTILYSLNHKKMLKNGVSDYMEILNAYSDKETNHLKLSEELLKEGIIEPMLAIRTDNNISDEQMSFLSNLSGKSALREKRDDFTFFKPLLDKPFWTLEQGAILSNNVTTEVFLNSGNRIFPTSDFFSNENSKYNENDEVYSFNIKSYKEAFNEARDLLENSSSEDVDYFFGKSDRESRIILVGAIVNDTLGLSNKKSKINVENVVEMFDSLKEQEEFKEYINLIGYLSNQDDEIKKVYKTIRSVEDDCSKISKMNVNNSDYVLSVMNQEVEKKLSNIPSNTEQRIIANIDGDFSYFENNIKNDMKKEKKKSKQKVEQLGFNM